MQTFPKRNLVEDSCVMSLESRRALCSCRRFAKGSANEEEADSPEGFQLKAPAALAVLLGENAEPNQKTHRKSRNLSCHSDKRSQKRSQ